MNEDIKGFIKPMMNGDDESVMKALLLNITTGNLVPMREYMSELWARGITKEQFLTWVDNQKTT